MTVYWNRRCTGGDLPASPNDASDGWAAAENIAGAVSKLAGRDTDAKGGGSDEPT